MFLGFNVLLCSVTYMVNIFSKIHRFFKTSTGNEINGLHWGNHLMVYTGVIIYLNPDNLDPFSSFFLTDSCQKINSFVDLLFLVLTC